MALNRTLALPLAIGGIISGAAIPALGATSIPLPSTPNPQVNSAPATTAAMNKTAPQYAALEIAVGAVTAPYKAGAENKYTVLVRNTGTAEARNVPVLLALPLSAKFATADDGGTAEYGGVVWTTDIKPMQQVALHAVAIAGRSRQDVEEVVATTCALKTATTAQVCASALLPVAQQATPAVMIKPEHAAKATRGRRFARRVMLRR